MSNTPRQRSASLRPAPSPSIPDGGRDPVRSASQLLGVAGLVAAVPAVDETIILPLDHDGIGRGIVVISGTQAAAQMLDCVELVAQALPGYRLGVVSVRPSTPLDDHDIDLWCEGCELATAHGGELVDWLVVSGNDARSVPNHFGFAPRPGWSPG